MGYSVLDNLTDLQRKEKNYLFSLCFKGGVLIIEDSTDNRYVHNRTERFPLVT